MEMRQKQKDSKELIENLSAADVMREVAKLSHLDASELDQYMVPDAFRGKALCIDEERRLILVRYAHDQKHLVKEGNAATAETMRDASHSPQSKDNGAVHTSAALNWGVVSDWIHIYPMYGIFKIPIQDVLELAHEGKVVAGWVDEAEIILSGDIAGRYLVETHPSQDMGPLMRPMQTS